MGSATLALLLATTVVHYDVDARLDLAAGTISAVAMLSVRAHGPDSSLSLASGDLVVDSVVASGRSLLFSATGSHVEIRWPQPLAAGKTAVVAVRYHGEPKRGLRFLKEQRQAFTVFSTSHWLPCLDEPDQKATFRLRLTVPDGLTAVASGDLVKHSAAAGLATYEWRQTKPLPTYVFGFAIGPFRSVSETHRDVRLDCLGTTLSDADLRRACSATGDMMDFFSERAGVPYPNPVYTQVFTAANPEQEVGSFTLLGEGYARRLLDDRQDVWLQAHELSHQWWGNGVTCRDWTHFWLNEGLATFVADAYKEKRFGRDVYLREIESSKSRYLRVRDAGEDKPLVFPDWNRPSANDRTIVYSKGAYVLHLLREQLGEEKFWSGLRAYTRRYMWKSVTTPDFQRAMEQATGTDLGDFFERWVSGS
jgi:aminopeptidase N